MNPVTVLIKNTKINTKTLAVELEDSLEVRMAIHKIQQSGNEQEYVDLIKMKIDFIKSQRQEESQVN